MEEKYEANNIMSLLLLKTRIFILIFFLSKIFCQILYSLSEIKGKFLSKDEVLFCVLFFLAQDIYF